MIELSSLFSQEQSSNIHSQLLEKLTKWQWWAVLLGSSGLLSCLVGGYFLVTTQRVTAVAPQELWCDVSEETIVVDVSGAVNSPGIYELQSNDRLANAIEAAGSFAEDVDQTYITTQLNLAQKISDGEKVYIPFIGENIVYQAKNALPKAETVSTLISINEASQSELESLPKIGTVTAEKIIANRPYQQIEDLLTEKVVSEGVFLEIRELIEN